MVDRQRPTIEEVVLEFDHVPQPVGLWAPRQMYDYHPGHMHLFAKTLEMWIARHLAKYWTNHLMMPIVVDVPIDTPPDALESAMDVYASRGWSVQQANNGAVLVLQPTPKELSELHSKEVEDRNIDDLSEDLFESFPSPIICYCRKNPCECTGPPLEGRPCDCGEPARVKIETLTSSRRLCAACYRKEADQPENREW